MEIVKEVSERFADFVFDWDYEKYLLIGGYGSGKSYDIALKIVLKLLKVKVDTYKGKIDMPWRYVGFNSLINNEWFLNILSILVLAGLVFILL